MKIETIYKLKQPLSHIGESQGTVSFLNTIDIFTGEKIEEVFALTGNAIRGTYRDCAARYLLNKLKIKLKKKEFNILFSGGNISGDLTVDIAQAKKYRELLPVISIFGAGIGNQILAGKMTQSFALPICKETKTLIPNSICTLVNNNLFTTSWKTQTGTINFTRFDDSKNVNLQFYLKDTIKEEDRKEKEASTQMRYEVEYLVAGSQLYHNITLCTENKVELGVISSMLSEFSQSPVLGGMGGKGFGQCDARFFLDGEAFITIEDGEFRPSSIAAEALEAYNDFISEKRLEIIELLEGIEK